MVMSRWSDLLCSPSQSAWAQELIYTDILYITLCNCTKLLKSKDRFFVTNIEIAGTHVLLHTFVSHNISTMHNHHHHQPASCPDIIPKASSCTRPPRCRSPS
ncbi:hypothetical protein IAQ61_000192 [Plenodomus lingam]|uniref:uncharacterized protein n=1 Tax=Leptosphaeria maculans TaxID=5022 RepID=UPI0033203D10|nr:hypothetical protein IAQ61_000192 [Plenodomus lingam]